MAVKRDCIIQRLHFIMKSMKYKKFFSSSINNKTSFINNIKLNWKKLIQPIIIRLQCWKGDMVYD